MGVQGKKRENNFESKQLRVGFVEGKVLCINPNNEEFEEILGITLKEESKATEYLGESKDGNTSLRVDFWFEDVKTGNKDKVTFFLEDKERENKDGTKKQYINSVGTCTWSDDEDNLPSWFGKDYRVAHQGEEEFYNFIKFWLAGLDVSDGGAELSFNWKNLMKGNLKEVKEQLNGEYDKTVGLLLEVKSVDKDGETKNYQSVYNKGFIYPSDIKFFRLVNYTDELIENLKKKKPKELKRHEKFVLSVKGEYGSKNSFLLKEATDFNPDDFLVASNAAISDSGSDY
jgi:hypothetical protein